MLYFVMAIVLLSAMNVRGMESSPKQKVTLLVLLHSF